MAKLGTPTNRWEMYTWRDTTTPRTDAGRVRHQVALRADGTVVRKMTFLKPDGKVDWDDGWKVATEFVQQPTAGLNAELISLGYTQID